MLTDYAWIDHRWQEIHWLEVFRMRLCGWLPEDLTADAVSNGLLLRVHTPKAACVVLTERARHLTDLAVDVGDSPQNCLMLANVLVTKGFNRSWMDMESHDHGCFLQANQVFPKTFRDNILHDAASLDPF